MKAASAAGWKRTPPKTRTQPIRSFMEYTWDRETRRISATSSTVKSGSS
jgi:hypothetical protein